MAYIVLLLLGEMRTYKVSGIKVSEGVNVLFDLLAIDRIDFRTFCLPWYRQIRGYIGPRSYITRG